MCASCLVSAPHCAKLLWRFQIIVLLKHIAGILGYRSGLLVRATYSQKSENKRLLTLPSADVAWRDSRILVGVYASRPDTERTQQNFRSTSPGFSAGNSARGAHTMRAWYRSVGVTLRPAISTVNSQSLSSSKVLCQKISDRVFLLKVVVLSPVFDLRIEKKVIFRLNGSLCRVKPK